MFDGLGIFKLNKREQILYSLKHLYNCVLNDTFIYMCSPDDDISKVLKYRVQAA